VVLRWVIFFFSIGHAAVYFLGLVIWRGAVYDKYGKGFALGYCHGLAGFVTVSAVLIIVIEFVMLFLARRRSHGEITTVAPEVGPVQGVKVMSTDSAEAAKVIPMVHDTSVAASPVTPLGTNSVTTTTVVVTDDELYGFLKEVDAQKYYPNFVQNQITLPLMRRLNDAQLRELGVLELGIRMRILDALSLPQSA